MLFIPYFTGITSPTNLFMLRSIHASSNFYCKCMGTYLQLTKGVKCYCDLTAGVHLVPVIRLVNANGFSVVYFRFFVSLFFLHYVCYM